MQNENKKSAAKSWDKGYYIALILCVAAVGISGYLFTTSMSEQPAEAKPTAAASTEAAAKPPKRAVLEELLPAAASDAPSQTEAAQAEVPQKELPAEAAQAPLATASPVDGAALQTYSMDHLSYNRTTQDWRTHDGVDFAAELGTQVLAAADGVVESVYDDDFLGKTLTLRHADGYVTRYSNLADELLVSVGDSVSLGDALGTVGRSALLEIASEPHLHFAVTKDGQSVDPMEFLAL